MACYCPRRASVSLYQKVVLKIFNGNDATLYSLSLILAGKSEPKFHLLLLFIVENCCLQLHKNAEVIDKHQCVSCIGTHWADTLWNFMDNMVSRAMATICEATSVVTCWVSHKSHSIFYAVSGVLAVCSWPEQVASATLDTLILNFLSHT